MVIKSKYGIKKDAMIKSIPEPEDCIRKMIYQDFVKQLMSSEHFKIKEEDKGDYIEYSTEFNVFNEEQSAELLKKIKKR